MGNETYDNLNLVGRHVPDYSAEIDAGGNKYQQELPGTYEVGILVGDTFLALSTFKAGNIIDQVKSMQKSASGPHESSSGEHVQQGATASGEQVQQNEPAPGEQG